MPSEKPDLRLIFMAVVFPLLAACSSLPAGLVPLWTAEPFTGQVVDSNGQPISGAILVGLWNELHSGHSTRSFCVRVETATTDANGSYTLPKWRNQYPILFAYKRGYRFEEWSFPPERYFATWDPKSYFRKTLQPFSGTVKERFEEFDLLGIRTFCNSAAETGTEGNFLSLQKAIYEEAKSIAQTDEDQKIVDYLLFRIEEIVLGHETALKRRFEREHARSGR